MAMPDIKNRAVQVAPYHRLFVQGPQSLNFLLPTQTLSNCIPQYPNRNDALLWLWKQPMEGPNDEALSREQVNRGWETGGLVSQCMSLSINPQFDFNHQEVDHKHSRICKHYTVSRSYRVWAHLRTVREGRKMP